MSPVDPKSLEGIKKMLDTPFPIKGPIFLAQDTARELGIDVDKLVVAGDHVRFSKRGKWWTVEKITADNMLICGTAQLRSVWKSPGSVVEHKKPEPKKGS